MDYFKKKAGRVRCPVHGHGTRCIFAYELRKPKPWMRKAARRFAKIQLNRRKEWRR